MGSYLLRGYIFEDDSGMFFIVCKCCDLTFEQFDELKQHLSETQTAPGTQIQELPAECLTKIFQYLTPNQLVIMSQVCRQFKALAEKVFELYFDPGPIHIKYDLVTVPTKYGETTSTQCSFRCRLQYEIAFPSSIRRLTIPVSLHEGVNGENGYRRLFQFIRKNCPKNLISLEFADNVIPLKACYDEIELNDRRIYGEIAKDHLKHLKHLRVKDVPFEHLYGELLQYTEHLTTLNVIHHGRKLCRYNEFCPHFDSAWTHHTYPKLESICVQTSDKKFDLMPMIRRHPNLRSVICNSLATIEGILQSDLQFNYVAIMFSSSDISEDDRWHGRSATYSGFRRLYKDVVEFGRSNRFEEFELGLDGMCPVETHRIEGIPNLTGLHLGSTNIRKTDRVTRLPMIEKLCVSKYFVQFRCNVIARIDQIFPNLTELRINAHNAWYFQFPHGSYFQEIFGYVLYEPEMFENLEQFYYENDQAVKFSWDDVVDINLIRSERLSPSKITVYLDPEHFHRFNKNVVELPFIEVKPWIHGGCPVCLHEDSPK